MRWLSEITSNVNDFVKLARKKLVIVCIGSVCLCFILLKCKQFIFHGSELMVVTVDVPRVCLFKGTHVH